MFILCFTSPLSSLPALPCRFFYLISINPLERKFAGSEDGEGLFSVVIFGAIFCCETLQLFFRDVSEEADS